MWCIDIVIHISYHIEHRIIRNLYKPAFYFFFYAAVPQSISSLVVVPSLTKPTATRCASACVSWSTNCWAVWQRTPRSTTTSLIGFTKPCWFASTTNIPTWGFRLRWPWRACSSPRSPTVPPSAVCFPLKKAKIFNWKLYFKQNIFRSGFQSSFSFSKLFSLHADSGQWRQRWGETSRSVLHCNVTSDPP